MKKENLIGQRFTKLVVLNEAVPNKYGHTRWHCVCDCGNKTDALASDLKRGSKPSCGCLKSEKLRQIRSLPAGCAGRNHMYAQYRKSAQQRGIVFELTHFDFINLIDKNCHYCGVAASLKAFGETRMRARNINGNFIYTGIDRKDNNQGYLVDNCVPCCKTCNFAKNDMPYDEFIAYLKQLVLFRNGIK